MNTKTSKHPMDFQTWLKYVDDACQAYCGLGYEDLPDCCYADWYENGVSPQAAAKRAIRAAKNGGEY